MYFKIVKDEQTLDWMFWTMEREQTSADLLKTAEYIGENSREAR